MIKEYLKESKNVIEQALSDLIPEANGDFKEHLTALRYSLFVGGKRIRPILCLAAGKCISSDVQESLLPTACAIECIHTYSLIHDDLPAMDNDDLRRGKPTNHVLFGEAEAILAGDGLLTIAFELLSDNTNNKLDPHKKINIINLLAKASGSMGMVGGQALDIANENKLIDYNQLQTIHKSKTGALITASVLSGAVGAGCTPDQFKALKVYGDNIGLAFQIVDDLLNVTSDSKTLGKAVGSDAENGKATYPALFGIEGTKEKASQAIMSAQEALSVFDNNSTPLYELATYILQRTY